VGVCNGDLEHSGSVKRILATNSGSLQKLQKRKDPPSDGLEEATVEHERAWLLMLAEMYELLDFTTKVNENAQEVLYEDEDNDDNDDVEEFARNSIPVLDTDCSYQMRLARNCFFFFLVKEWFIDFF